MNSRRTPFDEMDRAFESMRRSMENMLRGMNVDESAIRGMSADDSAASRYGDGRSAMSEFRTEETEDGYVVLADLPGFEKSEIEITVDDRDLTVAAERTDDENGEYHSLRRRRSVRRSMALPEGVRAEEISANYRNGVLELHLPADRDHSDVTHVRID